MTRDPSVPDLVRQYWTACAARGEPARRVYVLRALKGASQPMGHPTAWGVGRGYVEMIRARLPDPDKWEITEILP